ncbi:MAG: T9SS type A sorting domain-containing protein [Caldithrix sp.]|nr:T9SS type A sorting domain-containing protein [Caldithrix sp.]
MPSKYLKLSYLVCFVVLFMGVAEAQNSNLLTNPDLEMQKPAFWNKLNESGGTLTWATDDPAPNPWNHDLPGFRSLKVEKNATGDDMVGWKSDNNANLYWNNASGGTLYSLTFWAKTSGVNTSPANQDEMIGVWFRFYSDGSLITEQFVEVDQSAADMDWKEYTGAITVGSEPDEVYAEAVMGKNATGTTWFDNVNASTDPWSMGMFNGDVETPEGWMYWSDTGGDHLNFCYLVEDTGAHSGNYAALLHETDTDGDEMVYYSEPAEAKPNTWYKIGVWVKTDSVNHDPDWLASNVTPDRDNNRAGVTFFFHRDPIGENWDLTGGDQFFYIDQRDSASGWTHYNVIAQSPEDAAGVSMRARLTSFPTGYVWYDDFTVQEVTVLLVSIDEPGKRSVVMTKEHELMQNYPNPFNPETLIEYRVPEKGEVQLNVYDMMGRKIRTLVNGVKPAGTYQATWDGRDDAGNKVSTGMYIYQLKGKNALVTKRMLLIK